MGVGVGDRLGFDDLAAARELRVDAAAAVGGGRDQVFVGDGGVDDVDGLGAAVAAVVEAVGLIGAAHGAAYVTGYDQFVRHSCYQRKLDRTPELLIRLDFIRRCCYDSGHRWDLCFCVVSRVFFFFLLLVEGFGRSVAVAALVGVVFSGMTIWLCSASVVFSGFSQFGFAAIRWKVKENNKKNGGN